MEWMITAIGPEIDDEDMVSRLGRGRHSFGRISRAMTRADVQAEVDRRARDPRFTHEFRLYDDDSTLYYVGVCGNVDEADADDAFEPLDWAMDDVGATWMETRKRIPGQGPEEGWSQL